MVGSPGAGKTLLARALPGILPEMSLEEALTFPANFQLVAAMNPCPCGYYGDPLKPCTCAPAVVTKYQKRISGPVYVSK